MDTRDRGPPRYSRQTKGSRSLPRTKNVGTQLRAGDSSCSDMAERGPVLRVEESFIHEPVRDGLLANRPTLHELGEAISERSLATRDLDGASQSSNVRFIHEHRLYKHTCDVVNKPACVTDYKAACTVDFMQARQRKEALARPRKRTRTKPFVKGADGRTANERLREAFNAQGPAYIEADLRKACNLIAGKTPAGDDYVSQQTINNYLKDENDLARSSFVAVIAEALGVRAVWLQLGKGTMKDERGAILDELLDQVAKRRAR